MRLFIFGYGSLVSAGNMRAFRARHGLSSGEEFPAVLSGYRRDWSIAMNNQADIPRYKYYVEAGSDRRPEGFFAFLNIQRMPGGTVNGRVLEVEGSDLEAFDIRERNYNRVDVTDRITPRVPGQCMTYVGTPEAMRRAADGRRQGRLFVTREYVELVEAAFREAGDDAARFYRESTDHHDAMVLDVERRDIQGNPDPR